MDVTNIAGTGCVYHPPLTSSGLLSRAAAPSSRCRPALSSARPSRARGGPWLLVEEILGKSAGSKSPHLVTISRHVCCYHAGNGGKNRAPGRSSTYRTGAKGRRLQPRTSENTFKHFGE